MEPTAKKNGVAEYHKGDIGNFTADANGNGTISFNYR
jgi:Cu-Zn family superoxide dismutase